MSKKLAMILITGLILAVTLIGQEQTPPQEQVPPQEAQEMAVPEGELAPEEPGETVYTNDSVARLSHLTGSVFLQRASDIGYEECVVNTPVTEGDRLGTTDGRAEVRFGPRQLCPPRQRDQARLPEPPQEGRRHGPDPGLVRQCLPRGVPPAPGEGHRDPYGRHVVLRSGRGPLPHRRQGEHGHRGPRVPGPGRGRGRGGLDPGQGRPARRGGRGAVPSRPSQFMAAATDGFDRWNDSRNVEVSKRLPKRYLPSDLEDFEYELGQYGDWMYLPPYGNVWVPRGDRRGLAPLFERPLDLAAALRLDLAALRALGLVDLPLRPLALGHRPRLVLDPLPPSGAPAGSIGGGMTLYFGWAPHQLLGLPRGHRRRLFQRPLARRLLPLELARPDGHPPGPAQGEEHRARRAPGRLAQGPEQDHPLRRRAWP